LSGEGRLKLFFAATHDPNTLAVQVDDIGLMLRPFRINIAGRDEPVEIPQTFLGRQVFDVDGCNGSLNVKTKEITLHLRLRLTHECFPQLAAGGVSAPVSVHIVEKGQLDLALGTLKTHAASFDASGGVMHSLVVHPGAEDEKPALEFRNSIGTPNDASMSA